MPLPPWVNPPNFLGAIQAGTQAGISLRNSAIAEAAQRQRAQEAAAQLAFNYTQLQAQNERAAAQVQAEQERAIAANLLRAQQQNAMNAYREMQASAMQKYRDQQQANATAALTETARHNRATEALRPNSVVDGKIPALPVVDKEGKTLGWGVPGQSGAVHMLPRDNGAELTKVQRVRVLQDRLRALTAEFNASKLSVNPEVRRRHAEIPAEMNEINRMLDELSGIGDEDSTPSFRGAGASGSWGPEQDQTTNTLKVISIRQK